MTKTVVVVDDGVDFLDLLQIALSPMGYRVIQCDQSEAAHALVHKVQPDVVVLDIFMPGYSGWEVIQQLKQDTRTARAPIVVCTAAVMSVSKHFADLTSLTAGVLLKPFELDQMLALLARVTETSRVS